MRDLLSREAKLHYLSQVHVPRIPLYLAAGPCLEVSSENEATSRWLSEGLLGQEHVDGQDTVPSPWWSQETAQSEYGMLLSVAYEETEPRRGNNLTELLFYAAVKRNVAELPIPLPSSSPASPEESYPTLLHGDHLDVKVYALPLCSTIFDYGNRARLAGPTKEDLTTSREAIFLPQNSDFSHLRQEAHQKRPSISSLFEDAKQKRRKLKGRGGESISKAMAEIDRPLIRHGLPSSFDQGESENTPMLQAKKSAKQSLSRSSSLTSITNPELPRPASRSGPRINGKRSSLHRVESAISPRNSPILCDEDGDYAQKNKAALTKVVMAGMRLHGFQQKKRLGKSSAMEDRPNTATSIGDASPFDAEDEFKLVYHQTFKAAMFTFRRHFSAHAISQDVMRDIVDRFLSLFCSDLLVGSEIEEAGLTSFGMSSQRSAGAFDEPSAGQSSMPGSVWSPHTVKKR